MLTGEKQGFLSSSRIAAVGRILVALVTFGEHFPSQQIQVEEKSLTNKRRMTATVEDRDSITIQDFQSAQQAF